MAALEFGSMREAWFNTLADPATKYSFLLRDDAYQVSSATFGRTARLGDPIALGPGSGWRQLSWEGGQLQDVWRDVGMYRNGTADTQTRAGGIRLWPGFDNVVKRNDAYVVSHAMCSGSGDGTSVTPVLYVGERSPIQGTSTQPTGGFKAYSYNPTTQGYTQLNPTYPATLTWGLAINNGGFTAVAAATDDGSSSEYIYFGTNAGLFIYYKTTDSWFPDNNSLTAVIAKDSMVSFGNALYYCATKSLVKRSPLAPYGTDGTHTIVATHQGAARTQGLTVWNNRLYYGAQYAGSKATIHSSDGVTATQVFAMPEDFQIGGLISHYGALYIYGTAPQKIQGYTLFPAGVGQVWRYNGATLTKLWESDDGTGRSWNDTWSAGVYGASTMGPLLLWGASGKTGAFTDRSCVMAYDAEKDAIVRGPELPQHPSGRATGSIITSIVPFGGTFAVSVRDLATYPLSVAAPTSVLVWRRPWEGIGDNPNVNYSTGSVNFIDTFKGYSTEYADTVKQQYILSSEYYGDTDEITGVPKVWLSGQIRVKVPDAECGIQVYAITGSGKWVPPGLSPAADTSTDNLGRDYQHTTGVLVADITYNGDTAWRAVPFELVDSAGTYLTSTRLRYGIVLSRTASATATTTPEVDTVEVAWSIIPPKRRQWRVRFVLSDDQLKINGESNRLSTAQLLADKLEEFWSSSTPFMFYPPDTGDGPSNVPVKVFASRDGYQIQQYRVDSSSSEVMQEVAMTLIEHVPL